MDAQNLAPNQGCHNVPVDNHGTFEFVKNMVCYTDQSAGSAYIQDNLFIQVMLTSSLSTSPHSYFECDSMIKKEKIK